MSKSEGNLIKKMFVELLKVYGVTLLSVGIMALVGVLIGFIDGVRFTNTENLIYGVGGVIVEGILLFVVYSISFCNQKYDKFKTTLYPIELAFALRFSIAFFAHFYPILCGYGICYFGHFFFRLKYGMEMVAEQKDILHYFFIFSTFIQSAVDFAAVSLAFLVTKKKREKERDKLMAEEALRKEENE